jgi:hypothetical protein
MHHHNAVTAIKLGILELAAVVDNLILLYIEMASF